MSLAMKLPLCKGVYYNLKLSELNSHGSTNDPKEPKQSWERGMELGESSFLTSDHVTKLQPLQQYGTGAKTEP